MSNQSYEDLSYWGTCASDPSVVCEKPSPLRIVKADENMNKRHTTNQSNPGSSKHRRSIQGDGSLTVAKRRKINPGQTDADQENLRWPHDDPVHPYAWGSRPHPSYQSGRQDRCAQSPGANWDKTTLFPPRYQVNCLGAFLSNADLPLALHATSREEESPLFRRSPPVALTESFKTLPWPRLESWSTPKITITPEATTIEEGCHRFWVAIEVSVRRWPESAMKCEPGAR
ncbi:hypothetical protein LB504_002348 [Fusarium proliferatum]|nr:hypothetical protein LB504_002348 [Fusarium proliferatum]